MLFSVYTKRDTNTYKKNGITFPIYPSILFIFWNTSTHEQWSTQWRWNFLRGEFGRFEPLTHYIVLDGIKFEVVQTESRRCVLSGHVYEN